MNYALFLDDYRNPEGTMNSWRNDWIIVRSYDKAVNVVKHYGLPLYIAFDHDLNDEHYDSFEAGARGEKTGYSFAKWFCDYIMENDLTLDDSFGYFVHSMNPVGAKNIDMYMKNFLRDIYKHPEYTK